MWTYVTVGKKGVLWFQIHVDFKKCKECQSTFQVKRLKELQEPTAKSDYMLKYTVWSFWIVKYPMASFFYRTCIPYTIKMTNKPCPSNSFKTRNVRKHCPYLFIVFKTVPCLHLYIFDRFFTYFYNSFWIMRVKFHPNESICSNSVWKKNETTCIGSRFFTWPIQ